MRNGTSAGGVEVLVEEDADLDGRCVQVGHTKEYIKVALGK